MSAFLVRANQRRAFRRAVRIECQVVRERDFKLVGQRTVDLSPEGMLVASDVNVLTGEDVIVSFLAPFTRLWVDAEAVVTRVVHGRRPGDRGHCLGLRFQGIDDVARALLRANLRGLPPPMPSRMPRIDYAATVRNLAYAS